MMAAAFKQVVHQNLECPVCLSFFKDPKILTCSHTFCKGCLGVFLESHQNKQQLVCPVCRKETSVPDEDVNKLQTNIALGSLVADVETQSQLCAVCDQEDKPLAVVYCKECGDFLCDSCQKMHSKWVRFSGHSIVPASDALSGKVPLKRRMKCHKHPNEEEECFCLACNKYICFRCGMLEHAHEGHEILEAAQHENSQKKNIDELTSKAEAKLSDVDKYVTFVVSQRERMQEVQKKLDGDIDEAFKDAVKKLMERKVMLKSEVGERMKEFETGLVNMEETGRQQIVQINAVCGLVKNGLKVPLQKEALTAHKTLCQEMEQLLGRVDHDEKRPRKTADEGNKVHFTRSKRSGGFELGQLHKRESWWTLFTKYQLPMLPWMRWQHHLPMQWM